MLGCEGDEVEEYDEYEDEYEEDEEGEEEIEGEERKPTEEELEYLELRKRLKERYRKKFKKESSSTLSSSCDKNNRLPYDNYGSFFGPSTPVISQRVIQESKSFLKDQHLANKVSHSHHDLTLSGILNFIDGLWSSCGDERIVVFTTNHKDRIDPALLRPGRMDVHISMSYCSLSGFKLLASNYLGIKDNHSLFGEIEGLIQRKEVTPAVVAEELMKSDDADVVLQGFVNFLKQKRVNEANEVLAVKKEVLVVKKGQTKKDFVTSSRD